MTCKMKRIKTDQIHTILTQYMKRRKYTQDSASDTTHSRRQQSATDFAVAQLVQTNSSSTHLFTFSSVESNGHAAQFARFRAFVQEHSGRVKEELETLLHPLFAYLYLDLLTQGHKTAAHKLYTRHSGALQGNEAWRPILESLGALYSPRDVQQHKSVTQLLENKYTATLTEESVQHLTQFLKTDNCNVLLHIFNTHVHIKARGCCVSEDLSQQEERHVDNMDVKTESCSPQQAITSDPVSESSLHQSIMRVRSAAPPLPFVALYTLTNSSQGLCNATFSADDQQLACAFEDSSIQLWSLQKRNGCDMKAVIPSTPPTEADDVSNICQVHLNCDFIQDVHEKNRSVRVSAGGAQVLRGHSGSVYSLSFTPDCRHLLSASRDTTVRLWDPDSGRNLACYRGHQYPVWSVKSSPACDLFASASKDRCAAIWSLERLYPLRMLAGHTADVDVVSFHSNGCYVATGSCDHTVRLWSVQEGRCVRLMQGHNAPVLALAFSPDGKLLASAGEDKRVRVWDLGSGGLLKELRGHTDTVHTLCFNKHSSLLLSGGADCVMRAWDVRGEAVPAKQPEQHHHSVELLGAVPLKSALHCLAYSAHNHVLAAGGSVT